MLHSQSLLLRTLLLAFFAGVSVSQDATGPAKQYQIKDAATLGAVCLDGTPGMYYLRNATTEAATTKWHIHLQGGGWCTSLDSATDWKYSCSFGSCEHRALSSYLGSTGTAADMDELPFTTGMFYGVYKGFASNDCGRNPALCEHNWVFVRYCDGGGFQGDVAAHSVTTNGTTLYFRGNRILYGVLNDLLEDHNMMAATEIVLSGTSAGGGAVVVMIDEIRGYIHDRVRAAAGAGGSESVGFAGPAPAPKAKESHVDYAIQPRMSYDDDDDESDDSPATPGMPAMPGMSGTPVPMIVALIDSGVFAPQFRLTGAQGEMATQLWWTLSTMQVLPNLNRGCVLANAHESEDIQFSECANAGNAIEYVETPVFVVQSLYDSINLVCLLDVYTAYPGNEGSVPAADTTTMTEFVEDYMHYVVRPLLSEDTSQPNGMAAQHKNVALFIDSCPHHGFTTQSTGGEMGALDFWGSIYVGGKNAATAFDDWYTAVKASGALGVPDTDALIDVQPSYCYDCCDNGPASVSTPEAVAVAVTLYDLGAISAALHSPFPAQAQGGLGGEAADADDKDSSRGATMSEWVQSNGNLLAILFTAVALSCVVGVCVTVASVVVFHCGRCPNRQNKYAFVQSHTAGMAITTDITDDSEVNQLNKV